MRGQLLVRGDRCEERKSIVRHKHIGTFLGAAIHDLVEADKFFEAALIRHGRLDYGSLVAQQLERLHLPVVEARKRLLHLLAQEAVSHEERAALEDPRR